MPMLKTFTQAGPKRTSVAFGAIAAATVGASLASVFGVRINTSYSLPMGLYMRTSDPHASLIEFCPSRYALPWSPANEVIGQAVSVPMAPFRC